MAFTISIEDPDDSPVITLKNTVTGCAAVIYAFGGLLNAFYIPAGENLVNIIDGYTAVSDAKENITHGFRSAKMSPFVCRMRNGRYVFREEQYKVHGHYMDDHAIHGLLYGNSYEVMQTHADAAKASVTLQTACKGDDPGYPFPYLLTVNWTLTNHIQEHAVTHLLSVTTTIQNLHTGIIPLSDGWHPYFSLGTEIDDCLLQFDSDAKLEFDKDLLPTGALLTDERFISGTSLKDIVLDNCFILNHARAQPRCVLQNALLRLEILPDSAYPYLQIYTPPHRKSIAIENLSSAPDAFNNGNGLVLLQPHMQTSCSTRYSVTAL